MIARAWKNLSIRERYDILVDIPEQVWEEVRGEEEKEWEKRREILGLDKGEEVVRREYNFELPFDLRIDDVERARKVLEKVAEKKI